jgi:hypothetical protein
MTPPVRLVVTGFAEQNNIERAVAIFDKKPRACKFIISCSAAWCQERDTLKS